MNPNGSANVDRYYVYVVELAEKRGVRPAPSERPDVYVGSSALTPEARFQKHRSGARTASRHVRRRGVRLRPDLYAGLNPLRTREEAKAAERRLARTLEARGYRVYGSCTPNGDECVM